MCKSFRNRDSEDMYAEDANAESSLKGHGRVVD